METAVEVGLYKISDNRATTYVYHMNDNPGLLLGHSRTQSVLCNTATFATVSILTTTQPSGIIVSRKHNELLQSPGELILLLTSLLRRLRSRKPWTLNVNLWCYSFINTVDLAARLPRRLDDKTLAAIRNIPSASLKRDNQSTAKTDEQLIQSIWNRTTNTVQQWSTRTLWRSRRA